jgi:hypothetical protein
MTALPNGPVWLWVAVSLVVALLVALNWPRNLLTSAIMVASAVVGVWALVWGLEQAQQTPPTDPRLYLAFLFALFASATLLLPTAVISAWSLARRKPLQRKALALSVTSVGVLLAGVWAAFLLGLQLLITLGA